MNAFSMGHRKGVVVFILVISFIIITEQAYIESKSRTHNIHKRSCNVRGEDCLKDIDCCTAECVCYTNSCKCGTRPRVKVSKLGPQSLAQRLVCHYR